MAFDISHGENAAPERVYWARVGKEATKCKNGETNHSKLHRKCRRRAVLCVKSENQNKRVRRFYSTRAELLHDDAAWRSIAKFLGVDLHSAHVGTRRATDERTYQENSLSKSGVSPKCTSNGR